IRWEEAQEKRRWYQTSQRETQPGIREDGRKCARSVGRSVLWRDPPTRAVAKGLRESHYRLLVRVVGVARGFALAVLRTVIVPSRATAGVGASAGYFLVVGQIKRQG